jgi:hypothetical protein
MLLSLGSAWGFVRAATVSGEDLRVTFDKSALRVTAPTLRFISGRPLDRLHNGAPVPFALQLSISTDRFQSVLTRDIQRFIFSYDLWEEKFTVVKLGGARTTQSHLTARTAEAWCVGAMAVGAAGLASRQPFWLRLEARAENPGEDAGIGSEQGVTLARLIEFFSRRTHGEPSRWVVDCGPLRLAELR